MKKGTIALLLLTVFTLSPFAISSAYADPHKPDVLTGSVDYSKTDSALSKVVDYAAYIAYACGVIAVVIGVIMLTPVVGSPEKGQKALKGGAIVIAAAALIHIGLSALGSLFS